ncbi:NYN domain-containing protein [Nostocoides jenkinsii]|uniref:NYN domain-containing protein n=1 Tax=Nostocoides jenkinsii Ben 74 TaxID=1193518 RepID=A0A077MC85_9MICO|nr:NYN domain-containing protein [Tetrasphaera jenkinsii]CCI52318.1 conserved hypothetical protein [Tetrasphaera jenkinsii Ben 74]
MRSYCAIYVDVGYLVASAATRVTGTSFRRGVTIDHRALIEGLIRQAEEDSGLPLLRVNWYDSGARPGGMPDHQQDEIGLLPRVKLRLGRINHSGEQKGVDLRIGLDLATHGRNRIVDVIYLVSGDDDLTEAVEEAQGHGVQVVLLAVPDFTSRPYAVARHLQREADSLILIDPETITTTVRSVAIAPGLIPESVGAATEDEAVPADAGAEPVSAAAEVNGAARPGGDGIPKPGAARPQPADVAPTQAHNAEVAEEATEPDGKPSVPSPSLLANKRPSTVLPPKPLPLPLPQSTLSYSTTTGQPLGPADDAVPLELVDEVVRQVIASWCASATPASVVELRREKPFIPTDLDRTLLLDLSSRSGVSIIDDATRYALRDRFWELIDRVRLT